MTHICVIGSEWVNITVLINSILCLQDHDVEKYPRNIPHKLATAHG